VRAEEEKEQEQVIEVSQFQFRNAAKAAKPRGSCDARIARERRNSLLTGYFPRFNREAEPAIPNRYVR
jgi:hypothetical protein